MGKKLLVILFLSSFVLVACGIPKTIHFVGESKNWHVDYVVDVLDEESESTHFTIRYIGEAPIPKRIKYKIEFPSGSSDGTSDLSKGGVQDFGGHSCSGCSIIREDDDAEATINWNGKSETFKLKAK